MPPQPFTLPAAIGNTPLVKITKLNPNPAVQIYAKLEGSNPGGSVKDRPAWYMIKKAIEDGSLTPDKTILEPTSGNTGIALAMIGASLGYHVKLVMPPCVSVERRSVLEAYGAEVVLSHPGPGDGWRDSPRSPDRQGIAGTVFHAQPIQQPQQSVGSL